MFLMGYTIKNIGKSQKLQMRRIDRDTSEVVSCVTQAACRVGKL
jgi:hypothetical protein